MVRDMASLPKFIPQTFWAKFIVDYNYIIRRGLPITMKEQVGSKAEQIFREQSLSMGETGAEGIELGFEIVMHVGTGVWNL